MTLILLGLSLILNLILFLLLSAKLVLDEKDMNDKFNQWQLEKNRRKVTK